MVAQSSARRVFHVWVRAFPSVLSILACVCEPFVARLPDKRLERNSRLRFGFLMFVLHIIVSGFRAAVAHPQRYAAFPFSCFARSRRASLSRSNKSCRSFKSASAPPRCQRCFLSSSLSSIVTSIVSCTCKSMIATTL